jgi:DeoR/GlpR family transcriptional regulator of sugar metabolism
VTPARPARDRTTTNTTDIPQQKRAIAELALAYVPRHGAIALDAGTTTQELAAVLPPHPQATVVTPSLSVKTWPRLQPSRTTWCVVQIRSTSPSGRSTMATRINGGVARSSPVGSGSINTLAAHDGVEVVALGGRLHPSTRSFAGQATVAVISELRVRTFFLAASGLSTGGVYWGNDFDAVTKRALIGVADEVILLTDSSKWSVSAMVRACSLSELDHVVVDDGVTDGQLAILKEHDVDVDVVPTRKGSR